MPRTVARRLVMLDRAERMDGDRTARIARLFALSTLVNYESCLVRYLAQRYFLGFSVTAFLALATCLFRQ